MKKIIEVDVLIVGAGPTGLMLSKLLNDYEVDFLTADLNKKEKNFSKATGIHSEVLEMFESTKIVDEFLDKSLIVDKMKIYSSIGDFVFTTREIETKYPFGISIQQESAEDIIRNSIKDKNCLLNNYRVEAIREYFNHCEAYLLNLMDNTFQTVKCKYIVGCDGVHSTVRKEMEIDYAGEKYKEPCLAADLILDEGLNTDSLYTYLTDVGMLMIFPLPKKNLVRIFTDVEESFEANINSIQKILDEHGGGQKIKTVEWSNKLYFNKRLAKKFSTSRVFLAGDSCHCHSPAGGHGMNLGLMDSYNLAWKLAFVLQEVANPKILESYEIERRPLAEKVIFRSDLQTKLSFWEGKMASGVKGLMISLLQNITPLKKEILKFGMELNMDYSQSTLNKEDIDFTHRGLYSNKDSFGEIPNLIEYNSFISAPRPGQRFPDIEIDFKENSRLHNYIINENFTLLFFDGDEDLKTSYSTFNSIKESATELLRNRIDCFIVTQFYNSAGKFIDKELIINDDGNLHHSYGAKSECLFLIRPDGYITYRMMPIRKEKLNEFIKQKITIVNNVSYK